MKPTRICFYGLFGQGNLGNECTLQAALYHTRQYFPDAKIVCICTGPDDTSARYNITAVPISRRYLRNGDSKPSPISGSWPVRWLRKVLIRIPTELLDWILAFKTLKDADALIVPGTGFLTDAFTSPLGWPYEIFKWSLIARLCRCRLLYVGVGAGPIYHPLSRWLIRSALSFADFRSYRDSSTVEYLEGIGFSRGADQVCPDLAFSLPQEILANAEGLKRRRPVVGIGLIDFPSRLSTDKPDPGIHRAYLEKLATFGSWLLAHDYDIRVLIGDFAYDSAVMKEFGALLKDQMSSNDAGRVADTPALSVEQLLSQLTATDLVVATRFHNVLLALILNKPVISVSFHHKCTSLMQAMGLSEYSQDMSELNVDRLIEQFGELEKNAERLKASIRQRTEECRRLLDEQYRVIFGVVGTQARRSFGNPSTVPPRPARDT
jgi:polysaccharide pyruvyl transferase WcaK-like protein